MVNGKKHTEKDAKAPPKKRGRPNAEIDEELAVKLALYGHTNDEIADCLGIARATFQAYLAKTPKFMDAIKRAKLESDMEVERALRERAIGYSHPDVHISNFQGEITVTDITKHYPPDTAAGFIWLKNRQPARWRDNPNESTAPDTNQGNYTVIDGNE